MKPDREEPETVVEAPVVKSKISIVVILSIFLGVLLTSGAVGGLLYFQLRKSLMAELLLAKTELQAKSKAVDEMKAQIQALSLQMDFLKEYSVARSSEDADKNKKTDKSTSVTENSTGDGKSALGKDAVVLTAPPPPSKIKKERPKPACDLVGKSPEEQSAILKKCVTQMDAR